MTSPPQPRMRPTDDLDLGITGASLPIGGGGKRKAVNDRQRKAAEADAEYERWRLAMVEQNWGRP